MAKHLLLFAATTGYQIRVFADAARRLGVDVTLATDRCHILDDPWGDHDGERWRVSGDETAAGLGEALAWRGEVTAAIARRHDLDEAGAPGERWDGAAPATLERCLLHLVQEYARHLGHLDVVRELIDGRTGES